MHVAPPYDHSTCIGASVAVSSAIRTSETFLIRSVLKQRATQATGPGSEALFRISVLKQRAT
eukprot:CAMPEP_0174751694 /NCGR_PEP_ID=MMETSP1094-20130205/100377_1 /TAXON_ID=156173 /ORGANISM="Chrysochromulina brevifilum, Strain UTEX LB 985" /LENGTH=61 /DNA_ID=CAMNT_0015957221 /DNA_START=126 /DNA_END=309 /DNA_ORIENTATION=+